MNTPRLFGVAVLSILLAFALEARAQVNLLVNGSFEDDGNLHGATSLTGWGVDTRGVGYYADLTTLGSGPDNLAGSVDVANFNGMDLDLGGLPTTSAAYDGTRFVDMIGSALGEPNHSQQNLNGVLYQAVTGLNVGGSYTLQFRYTITDYAAFSPRRLGVRIDLVDGAGDKVTEIYNEFETSTLDVKFLPSDPGGVITTATDTEIFGLGPNPADYSTLPGASLGFPDARTVAPNAISPSVSSSNIYDHVTASSESSATTRWLTFSHTFVVPAGPDDSVRISLWNNTFPASSPIEADYHWSDTAKTVWFGNQVGTLVDAVSLSLVPEPTGPILLFIGGAAFLLRRGRRMARP